MGKFCDGVLVMQDVVLLILVFIDQIKDILGEFEVVEGEEFQGDDSELIGKLEVMLVEVDVVMVGGGVVEEVVFEVVVEDVVEVLQEIEEFVEQIFEWLLCLGEVFFVELECVFQEIEIEVEVVVVEFVEEIEEVVEVLVEVVELVVVVLVKVEKKVLVKLNFGVEGNEKKVVVGGVFNQSICVVVDMFEYLMIMVFELVLIWNQFLEIVCCYEDSEFKVLL